jgi:sulfite exporter TauE/SafE/copper chaperone CopZ
MENTVQKQSVKCEFYVEGMHCAACELVIEKKLSKVEGIKKVDAKLAKGKVYIETNVALNAADLSRLIEEDGYKIVDEKEARGNINWKELGIAFLIASIVVIIFLLIQKSGIVNLVSADKITLPFVFFIGVIASLSSCMAVVGGLVLSLSSSYARGQKFKPLIAFHISRIVGFFFLGGLIGLLGSAFILTSATSFILNLALFIVMLILGINLLDIFPAARKFQIKMPKLLGKKAVGLENSSNPLAPILLGLATFVLPCGFTQSMQIYSLTTGTFIDGAITMFVFALGTFPILALISFASVKLSKTLQSGLFFKTSGLIVLFFALFNFTAALVAVGLISPIFNI